LCPIWEMLFYVACWWGGFGYCDSESPFAATVNVELWYLEQEGRK